MIVVLVFHAVIADFSGFVLSPLSAKPKWKLVFVMVITPLTFSVMQFWLVDNFLQGKSGADAEDGSPIRGLPYEKVDRRNNSSFPSQPLGLVSFNEWREQVKDPPSAFVSHVSA